MLCTLSVELNRFEFQHRMVVHCRHVCLSLDPLLTKAMYQRNLFVVGIILSGMLPFSDTRGILLEVASVRLCFLLTLALVYSRHQKMELIYFSTKVLNVSVVRRSRVVSSCWYLFHLLPSGIVRHLMILFEVGTVPFYFIVALGSVKQYKSKQQLVAFEGFDHETVFRLFIELRSFISFLGFEQEC